MEHQALLNTSKYIVARNVAGNVQTARVHWNPSASHLVLACEYKLAPAEDDLERQELAMTELLAEFPDVATAECLWSILNSGSVEDGVLEDGVLIYSRA